MKRETRATRVFVVSLIAAVSFSLGCDPEMPAPPPKVFGSSAEEDFDWAMERLRHAMEMFRPASSLGLSVKRELDYELILPSDKVAKYTARVTISTSTVYLADSARSNAQRKRADAKEDAGKIKLDNPYTIPGEETTGLDAIPLPEVPPAELAEPEVANPRLPTQQLKEKRDYLLEYVGGQWKLQTEKVEESERMWFDYALQQGEFATDAESKN